MDFFSISIATVILRFFLMMAVIIAGGFMGQFWLAALGLPIFLSVMLGLGIKRNTTTAIVTQQKNITARSQAA